MNLGNQRDGDPAPVGPGSLAQKYGPLLVSVLSVVVYAIYQYRVSLRQNGGQIVYALDDAYIHMAIAKNFALHGIWGVSSDHFSSSASSLLWPLLLSLGFKIFGIAISLPYVLNVFFACLILWLADAILRGPVPSAVARSLFLLLLLFLTPFAPLITSGMEHTLQIFIMLAFAWFASLALSNDESSPFKAAAPLMFLAGFFVAFVRYEDLVFAFVVCCLLFLRRRYLQSIALGLIVLLPVLIYGWISVRSGWYFLPNSVLLKSDILAVGSGNTLARLFSRADFFFWKMMRAPHLFFPAILPAFVFILRLKSRGFWEKWQQMLLMSSVGTILHAQFADAGWFYRYEAYLITLGFISVVGASVDFIPLFRSARSGEVSRVLKGAAIAAAYVVLLIPVFRHGVRGWIQAPEAMNDRYYEHIEAVKFVQRYYAGQTIMVNDIGAMSFFTDAKVLDIFGLGNLESGKYKIESRGRSGMTPDRVKAWSDQANVKIGAIQLEWQTVRFVIPNDWIMIGFWEIPRNVVFKQKINVIWFATSLDSARELSTHLEEFAPEVPSEIAQHGIYRGESFADMSRIITERINRFPPDSKRRIDRSF